MLWKLWAWQCVRRFSEPFWVFARNLSYPLVLKLKFCMISDLVFACWHVLHNKRYLRLHCPSLNSHLLKITTNCGSQAFHRGMAAPRFFLSQCTLYLYVLGITILTLWTWIEFEVSSNLEQRKRRWRKYPMKQSPQGVPMITAILWNESWLITSWCK